MNRLLHIARPQTASHNQFADTVNDSGPGLNSLPIEFFPRAPTPLIPRGIEHHPRHHPGAEAVRFKEKVAVLSDVNLMHAFALVSIIFLYQPNRNRVPSHRLSGGRLDNFRRPCSEYHGPAGSVSESTPKRPTEFHTLFAVQLHCRQTCFFDRLAYLLHGLVDENSYLLYSRRHLGDD